MTKQEFVDAVAGKTGLSKRDAGAAVDAFLDTVEGALKAGDRFGVRDDIASWAEATRLELVSTVGTGSGAFEFFLRKL